MLRPDARGVLPGHRSSACRARQKSLDTNVLKLGVSSRNLVVRFCWVKPLFEGDALGLAIIPSKDGQSNRGTGLPDETELSEVIDKFARIPITKVSDDRL